MASKDLDRVASLEADASFELGEYADAQASLITTKLSRQASKLGVAMPRIHYDWNTTPDPDYWYRSNWTAECLLTEKGVRIVRKRIRAEQKARAELRALSIPWISAIIGLIGAAIGIISLVIGKS